MVDKIKQKGELHGSNLDDTIVSGYDNYLRKLEFQREHILDGMEWLEDEKDIDYTIYGEGGSDHLYGEGGNDVLYGGESFDFLYGGIGNDFLDGGVEDDYLYGGEGNDTLDGGEGDDILVGGTGDNTYVFGANFGKDIIRNRTDADGSKSKDIISFKSPWKPTDFYYSRTSTDSLIIKAKYSTNEIYIENYFGEGNKIETIQFVDNTQLTVDQVQKQLINRVTKGNDDLRLTGNAISINGLAGNDVLIGTNGNDKLYGDIGNDFLYGGNGNDILDGGLGNDILDGGLGNDTLDGGTGNDSLKGGNGNDTYVFGQEFGQDIINNYNDNLNHKSIIRFKTGWKADDFEYIAYTPSANAAKYVLGERGKGLIIRSKKTSDEITIRSQFHSNHYGVSEIQFADGTILNARNLQNLAVEVKEPKKDQHGSSGNDLIIGTIGNDTLYGDNGSDTLSGGNGHDFLDGGLGNDTLYGGLGDDILDGGLGNDTLDGDQGQNTYVFGESFGQDVIRNTSVIVGRREIIQFKEGWKAQDFVYSADEQNELIIQSKTTSDQIKVIRTHFLEKGDTTISIQELRFSDGTVVGSNELIRLASLKRTYGYSNQSMRMHYGDDDNFYVEGSLGSDEIYGEAGDDIIRGYGGGDFLDGGPGDDVLDNSSGDNFFDGGTGNDKFYGYGRSVYLFGENFGQDVIEHSSSQNDEKSTILFKENWENTDFNYLRDTDNLVIKAKNSSDQITVDSYFKKGNQIDEIRFINGTLLNVDTITKLVANSVNTMKSVIASSTMQGASTIGLNQMQSVDTSISLLPVSS